MPNFENPLLKIKPVETYAAPKIPTFSEDNSALLKKLPTRWQKNAKVLACIGIMGTITLAGCFNSIIPYDDRPHHGGAPMPYYVVYPTEQELEFRLHHGGAGRAFYVVYFTEQEAFDIIRSRLETVSLNFDAIPPDYTVEWEWGWDIIGIDLFDSERNVAITHITREMNNRPFFSHGGNSLANRVATEFANMTDIKVGVFYTPEYYPDWDLLQERRGEFVLREPTNREIMTAKTEARPILVANLTAQVDEFIEFLRDEGIL